MICRVFVHLVSLVAIYMRCTCFKYYSSVYLIYIYGRITVVLLICMSKIIRKEEYYISWTSHFVMKWSILYGCYSNDAQLIYDKVRYCVLRVQKVPTLCSSIWKIMPSGSQQMMSLVLLLCISYFAANNLTSLIFFPACIFLHYFGELFKWKNSDHVVICDSPFKVT